MDFTIIMKNISSIYMRREIIVAIIRQNNRVNNSFVDDSSADN